MNYLIKLGQKDLMYIRHILAQRPFAEVSQLLANMDRQQTEQDHAKAIPIGKLQFESDESSGVIA